MKLWFANFDFEHELAQPRRGSYPAAVVRTNAELAACFAIVAETDDWIWMPRPADSTYPAHLQSVGLAPAHFVGDAGDVPSGIDLCPWGWTPSVSAWGRRNAWRCEHPELAAVATVNAREFASSLEQEWHIGIPGSRTIGSLEEFHRAATDWRKSGDRWVVKASFGMSARERIVGDARPPGNAATAWIQKKLRQQNVVHFEPWVDRLEEVGLQFTIPQSGEPRLDGIAPLLTDAQGVYRGSRVPLECAPSPDDPSAVELGAVCEWGLRAALRAQQAGYFGPLGIDAMKYRSADGEVRWRPLQDLNARWTMGRLALCLRRLIEPGLHASWLLVSFDLAQADVLARVRRIESSVPSGVRLVRTSPLTIGGTPCRRGALLIQAPSREKLHASESIVLEADTRGRADDPTR